MSDGVVIAGGGLAAQRCCETLRSHGFDGRIRIVGDEDRPPYDRPPLSKEVLSGERDSAALGFRPPEWYADHDGAHERSEHWEAATRQGAQVARAILGLDPAPPAMPSFWTDQYGLRIQIVGDAREADEIVIDGDPQTRDFEALMLRDGTPVAGMAVGRPRALPGLRRQIEAATAEVERSDDEVRTANR